MFKQTGSQHQSLIDQLRAKGYWPARAAKYLQEYKYSRAVEVCQAGLAEDDVPVSGRLIYAQALYLAGEVESATKQFHEVLSRDPDNLAALKTFGDIKFSEGDEVGALAIYRRILEIDPDCRGVKTELSQSKRQTIRTITLNRSRHEKQSPKQEVSLRRISFFTETVADIYMQQGYPRLAAEVYRTLNEDIQNPRLADKLSKAEQNIKDKER